MIDAIADLMSTNRGEFRRIAKEEAARRKRAKEGGGQVKVTDQHGFLNEEGRRRVVEGDLKCEPSRSKRARKRDSGSDAPTTSFFCASGAGGTSRRAQTRARAAQRPSL